MINVNISSRLLIQMKFFCGLLINLLNTIGIQGFLHIQEKLAEILSSLEIFHILGSGGFFYAASQKDFENAEERFYIDKYLRGRPGVSAEERIRLFKLAWDVIGSAFAQRITQYVTFYSGDPVRLTAGFYLAYDKDPLFDIVERALGTYGDLDTPYPDP